MGLDYTIYLTIKDKESAVKQSRTEIAYWRKCWTLSETLHDLCSQTAYSVPEKYQESYHTVCCSIIVLKDIIKTIKDELDKDYIDNYFWDGQVWENAIVRDMSIHNMANLYALQAWLNDKEDDEILQHAAYSGKKEDIDWLREYLKEKDKYELFIESEFSY